MLTTDAMRVLRPSSDQSDVRRSLSELRLLWRQAHLADSAISYPKAGKDRPMPTSIESLDGLRSQRNGNPPAGEATRDSAGAYRAAKAWEVTL